MTRGRARRYLLTKQGYYPQVVADAGYTVFDWDASRLSTLYQDSAKTTPVTANGDPVGAWVDGVQGVDAIQPTTANKPTYTTASLNGLPTLGFDGGDLLSTANIAISTFALWVVFKQNIATRAILYSHRPAGSITTLNINYTTDSLSIARSSVLSDKTTTISTLPGDSVYRTIRHEFDGTHTGHKLSVNNSYVSVSDGTNTNNPGDGVVSGSLIVGAVNATPILPITGNIGHLCIVSPYPTPAIIANMESYINGIWGVY